MTISLTTQGDLFVLNLGESENTFDQEAIDTVLTLLDEVERSGSQSPLLTVAEGKFWSNGFDLDWVMDESCREQTILAGHALLAKVLTLGRPTVAVLQGHAFGLGAMLAMAHDYRVMRKDRGFFCLPEVDIKLAFPQGMRTLLTAKMPQATLLDAMAYGHRFGGDEAVQAGIVHQAVGEEALYVSAVEMAASRAGKDPQTVSRIKGNLYQDVLAALSTAV